MNESFITVRYVKALYHLAEEAKMHDKVKNDVDILLNCIQQSPEFQFFIDNPLIKISAKLQLIDRLFSKQLNKLTMRFLHLLIKHKREAFLKNICHYYQYYYKNMLGIKEAIITTSIPLTPKHRDEIFKFISRKFKVNLELNEKVDSDIIGGFILKIEDQQINASIYHQLNKIKRELIHT